MIRLANLSDARFLWELRNEKMTRENSFCTDWIDWDKHQEWYRNKLMSQATRIYLLIDEIETPLGQIRYEKLTSSMAEVNLAIAPVARGKGYGREMLECSRQLVKKDLEVNHLEALVKNENRASLRLFMACGFSTKETLVINSHVTTKFIYTY